MGEGSMPSGSSDMGSLHYPALSSHVILPAMPLDTVTSTKTGGHSGGRENPVMNGQRTRAREDAQEEEEEEEEELEKSRRVRKRPESLPPILQPRGSDVRVASTLTSASRHSMHEVVSRMREREKTLLGEDLMKRGERKETEGDNKSSYKNRRTSKDVRNENSKSVSVAAADSAESSRNRAEWLSKQSALSSAIPNKSSRTRKSGLVVNGAQAWATPRGRPNGATTSSSLATHATTAASSIAQERRTSGLPQSGLPAVNGHANGYRNGYDYEDDSQGHQLYVNGHHVHRDDMVNGEEGGNGVTTEGDVASGTENDDDGDDDDDDDYSDDFFDYDEGEEEIEAQRHETRHSRTTEMVYQRSCESLKVQPSPAFIRQVNLTCMNLSDVRLGAADVKPIAIALVRDVKIIYLDLSHNDLGPVGVSYIAEMLQENTTLMTVNLSATNPGPEGVKALAETLPHNRNLAFLKLEENRIEHTESHLLADIIRGVPKLRGLFLGHNRLGYKGGAAIATALAQNKNVVVLDLHWNHIRRESAIALAKSLAKNSSLKTLNLAWNGLGKEGCLALAHALPKNTSLKELDLTCNRVDLMSLGFLLKGVTRNRSLTSLKLGQNPLTTDGAKALITAVTTVPEMDLTEIDLTGVPVDLEFTEMLAAAQKSRVLSVRHEEALTLATSDQKRDHDGTNLDRYDPVMVFFEYMKIDNLRVIDMFQFMDTKKRDKLSKNDLRDGLNVMKLPVTEHAIDVIHEKLDLNRDGFVELDEMMRVQRDTARQVKLRQIRAKSKKREDESLKGLHKILRDLIAKRTEDNENSRRGGGGGGGGQDGNGQQSSVTKTSGGGRKSSVGGLQLTQARYSVTSMSKKRGAQETEPPRKTSSLKDVKEV